MFTMETKNDFNEINIEGTIYKPQNGRLEVHVKSHVDILSLPTYGFTLVSADAESPAPAPAPEAPAQYPLNENHGNIWALLDSRGIAIKDTDTIDTILAAIDSALGKAAAPAPAAPPVAEKQLTPTEKARAELDALGVQYNSGSSLKVLQDLLEQHKPKE